MCPLTVARIAACGISGLIRERLSTQAHLLVVRLICIMDYPAHSSEDFCDAEEESTAYQLTIRGGDPNTLRARYRAFGPAGRYRCWWGTAMGLSCEA